MATAQGNREFGSHFFQAGKNIGNFAIKISLALLDIILHSSKIYLT